MKVGDLVQVNPVIPGLQDFIGVVIEMKNKEYPIIYIVQRTQPNEHNPTKIIHLPTSDSWRAWKIT